MHTEMHTSGRAVAAFVRVVVWINDRLSLMALSWDLSKQSNKGGCADMIFGQE